MHSKKASIIIYYSLFLLTHILIVISCLALHYIVIVIIVMQHNSKNEAFILWMKLISINKLGDEYEKTGSVEDIVLSYLLKSPTEKSYNNLHVTTPASKKSDSFHYLMSLPDTSNKFPLSIIHISFSFSDLLPFSSICLLVTDRLTKEEVINYTLFYTHNKIYKDKFVGYVLTNRMNHCILRVYNPKKHHLHLVQRFYPNTPIISRNGGGKFELVNFSITNDLEY